MSYLRAVLAFLLLGPSLVLAQSQNQADELQDLMIALSEIGAAKLCSRIKNTFQPLRSQGADNEEDASGTFWLNECTATQEGRNITLNLSGQGWRWAYRAREKFGAEFKLSDYVRFQADIVITGKMDAAYAPESHILSVWFKPQGEPEVSFEPIGELDVQEQGLWSEVVGAAASTFLQSPASLAAEQVRKQGRKKFLEKFSEGISVTVNLCTGEVEKAFAMISEGKMAGAPPDGAPISAQLHRNGLMITGPYKLLEGQFEVSYDVKGPGAVRAELVCESDAARLANAFVGGGSVPDVDSLAAISITGKATLRASAGQRDCPVAVVTRSSQTGESSRFEFSYKVDSAKDPEPLIYCPKSE